LPCVVLKAEEAKVKILEVTGDRVDNKSKLEVIRQEEEIIRRENEERKKEEEAEKLAKEKVLADAAAEAEVKFSSMPVPRSVFTLEFLSFV